MQIFPISEVLQPCCKPMERLLSGADGLAARAPKNSIQAKAYYYLQSKVKVRTSSQVNNSSVWWPQKKDYLGL